MFVRVDFDFKVPDTVSVSVGKVCPIKFQTTRQRLVQRPSDRCHLSTVYKGILQGKIVAVKKLNLNSLSVDIDNIFENVPRTLA